jgi:hypothetical protein
VTVAGEPFGFTVALAVAPDGVIPVAGCVVTVGALPTDEVVNERTEP